MPRRLLALAALVGGVLVLVGPGWALLALGGLLLAGLPATIDQSVSAALRRARRAAGATYAAALGAPKRSISVGCMTAGVLAVPVGIVLAAGVGAAIVAFGGLLLGVSLLTGWNA